MADSVLIGKAAVLERCVATWAGYRGRVDKKPAVYAI
jgi:hypothetical protein